MLVGQPELSARLEDPTLRQLKQRVALRTELRPFGLKETAGYIAARITIAGGRADALFTRDAVIAIHDGAKGLPRTISVICDNALVTGFAASAQAGRPRHRHRRVRRLQPDEAAAPARRFRIQFPTSFRGAGRRGTRRRRRQAAAEPAAPPSLFTEYGPSKRFSFFRGARR